MTDIDYELFAIRYATRDARRALFQFGWGAPLLRIFRTITVAMRSAFRRSILTPEQAFGAGESRSLVG